MNTCIEYYYGLEVRQLQQNDLMSVIKLQDKVYECLPDKTQFVLTTADEFAESIVYDYCIGAFSGDILAAVTTIVLNRASTRNVGYVLGFEAADCVTYDTTFVHPNYRGRGLQQHFMPIKDDISRRNGAKFAFATVAPDNIYSLRNLTESGFKIIDKKELYGGVDRLILQKDLRSALKEESCRQDC